MESGKAYHIYTHANGSENLFRTHENYRYFLQRYESFVPGVVNTLAYCLMPNHLHLLVRVKEERELLLFFKEKYPAKDQTGLVGEREKDLSGLVILQFSHLFNAYTKAYNKLYKRRGSLFTRSFKREEITDASYFTNVICYVHANPVHHGFVKHSTDWPWSSYQLILDDSPTFIKRDEILAWFGNASEYKKIHQQRIGMKMKSDDFKFRL